jgi:hypothetical protein
LSPVIVAAPWIHELRHAYEDAGGEVDDERRGLLPDDFYEGLVDSIGPEPSIDFVHPIDFNGTQSFLLASGNGAYIVSTASRTTEVTFLGDLTGGTYREKIEVGDTDNMIEMEFEHQKLGSKTLRACFAKVRVSRASYISTSDKTDRQMARGAKLRERFKRWAGFESLETAGADSAG